MGQLSLKQESRCAFQNDGDRHSGIHIQEGYVEEGRQQSLPLTQSVWHHSGGKPKPEFSCDLEETRAPRRSQAGGSPSASRSPNPIRNQRAMADGYGFLKLDHRLHPGERPRSRIKASNSPTTISTLLRSSRMLRRCSPKREQHIHRLCADRPNEAQKNYSASRMKCRTRRTRVRREAPNIATRAVNGYVQHGLFDSNYPINHPTHRSTSGF